MEVDWVSPWRTAVGTNKTRRPWARLHTPEIWPGLPLNEVSLAEALNAANYVCASIGKWHLGDEGFHPERHGFSLNFVGNHFGRPPSYFCPYQIPTIADCVEGEYLTDRLAYEAVHFIDENREKPFFLYWPHFAVHRPLQAKRGLIEKYQMKAEAGQLQFNSTYAAMVESLDEAVGKVLNQLEKLKIVD